MLLQKIIKTWDNDKISENNEVLKQLYEESNFKPGKQKNKFEEEKIRTKVKRRPTLIDLNLPKEVNSHLFTNSVASMISKSVSPEFQMGEKRFNKNRENSYFTKRNPSILLEEEESQTGSVSKFSSSEFKIASNKEFMSEKKKQNKKKYFFGRNFSKENLSSKKDSKDQSGLKKNELTIIMDNKEEEDSFENFEKIANDDLSPITRKQNMSSTKFFVLKRYSDISNNENNLVEQSSKKITKKKKLGKIF